MFPPQRLVTSFYLHGHVFLPSTTAPPRAPPIAKEQGTQDEYVKIVEDDLEFSGLMMAAGIGKGWKILIEMGMDVAEKFGIPTSAARRILDIVPEKNAKLELIRTTLESAESFSRAVIEIKDGWQDTTPEEALREGLRWFYSKHRKYSRKDRPPQALTINSQDIKTLKEKYGFTNDQLFNILYEINQEYGWLYKFMSEDAQYSAMWNEIYGAIADSDQAVNGSPELMTTQQLVRKGLSELESTERAVTKTLFEKLVRKLNRMEPSEMDFAEITIGEERVLINDPANSLDQIYRILGRLSQGEAFTKEDEAFIERLKKDDPAIQRIYDVTTKPVKDRIAGRDNFIKLVHISKSGGEIGNGVATFIERISTGTETVLLIVQNSSGKQVMPRMVVRSLGNGERFAQYERPYYVEPFSYHLGKVFTVKGSGVTEATGVIIRDGRGKEFFMTSADMAHFGRIVRVLSAKPALKRSELGRGFLKFFNAIQAIYSSADPTYKPVAGSPSDIPQRAASLSSYNWSSVLEKEVSFVLEDFFNATTRALGLQIDYENGLAESFERHLHERMTRIAGEHAKNFGRTKQSEFLGVLKALERAIIIKREDLVEEATGRIRKVVSQQTQNIKDATTWLKLQDVATDVRLLRDISPETFADYIADLKKEVPSAIRSFAVVWGTSSDAAPNLSLARTLLGEGSIDKSFAEYEKVVRCNHASADTKFMALAELADASYKAGQILRAGRALDRIEQMVLLGKKMPEEARQKLVGLYKELLSRETLLKLNFPANLRKELFAEKEQSITSSRKVEKNKFVTRFEHLPEAVQKDLDALIYRWAYGELSGYRPEFLRALAMCHTSGEAARLINGASQVSPDEMAMLKSFYGEATAVAGPFGFARYIPIEKEAKAALERLIRSWSEYKGFGTEFLRAVALARGPEVRRVAEAFGVSQDVSDFRESSVKIFDPDALFKKSESQAPKEEAQLRVRVIDMPETRLSEGVYQGGETEIDGVRVRPWYVSTGKKTYMVMRDVGGPAVFGAAAFLTGEGLVSAILPRPETHMEAFIYQYDIIGTSIFLEQGIQKLAEYIVNGGTNYAPYGLPAAASSLTLSGLAGSLGAGMFVYKGINEMVSTTGMSDRAVEITSLVGTGVVLGAWQQVVKKIFSPAQAERIIRSGTQIMTRGGTALFVADVVPTAFEAVYNLFDEDVSIAARERWHNCMKNYHYRRGIFGAADGVEWYDRIGNSVFNVLDDVFVPASWHKMVAPVLDGVAESWIKNCETSLLNGVECVCE